MTTPGSGATTLLPSSHLLTLRFEVVAAGLDDAHFPDAERTRHDLRQRPVMPHDAHADDSEHRERPIPVAAARADRADMARRRLAHCSQRRNPNRGVRLWRMIRTGCDADVDGRKECHDAALGVHDL
jgi:hypothetical protein